MSTAQPLLRKYQLFKLGVHLRTQGFSGQVLLLEADGRTTISFEAGNPVWSASTHIALSFPAFLLRKRRIDRSELKRLLEESSERGIRLDELLVLRKVFSQKDVVRLKRELSVFVFSDAFRKESVSHRIIAGRSDAADSVGHGGHLELHEGLFRAVTAERDLEYLSRTFREAWEARLVKTADFYRYLIQFRSVFYGEDIIDLLMEPDVTAGRVLDTVADKESATKQLFALCYSGMLAFEAADVRGRTEAGTQFGEEAGVAEESKTMVIMPGEEEERALVTSFLATEGAPFQEEERQKTAERPLSEVEEFLEKGFSAEIPEDDPILTRPRDVRNATRAAAEERDREEKEQKKRERPRPEPKPKPVRIPTPPIPVIPPLEEATDEPDAARTRPLSADAMVRVATPIPQEAQPADDKGNAGAEAAARQTLAMEIGPEASEKIESEGAAHVEALLKRAVEEAEKAVASRGKESALPPLPPAPRPILVPPLDVLATPGPIETPALIERVLSERILLALTEPPPLPERPPVPEPGTDEKIERTLEDVYRSMLSRNLYQVLNVTPFSPLSAIRDSGIRLRAKYEPAQYKGYMLSARARLLLRFVGEEIDRACAVLVDPAERTAYDNRINTDYGQDRRLALSYLFEAERNCDEGKASIEANNWPDALILFSKAAEANPRDPEYLAFRGWATYQALKAGQSSDSFAPNKARNILERALAVDPRHARALLFIARIEKEMGNLAAARTWYGRLQKVDPANEEALVQLDWLRTAVESEKPREESGVWDRFKGLFKKK